MLYFAHRICSVQLNVSTIVSLLDVQDVIWIVLTYISPRIG